MGGAWEKKMVYVLTAWLVEDEEEGNYSSPSEEYFADTLKDAERLKEELLEDSSIDDVWISDEKEEREFWVNG